MDLERVVYLSRAAATASHTLALADILAVSQRNNARDDITGALVIAPDAFLQVIEGGAGVVGALMHRVGGDPRHRDLRILAWTPIPQRLFAGWSMIVSPLDPALRAALDAPPAAMDQSIADILGALRDRVGDRRHGL